MRIAAISIMALLLLAGCTDKEPTDPEPPEGDGDGGGPSDGDGSGADGGASGDPDGEGNGTSGGADPDHAPTITMAASIRNGTAPVNTTITVIGADEDDDVLHWTIDVGGDGVDAEGDGSQGTHTVDFQEAGRFEVIGTVSDGNHTVNTSIEIVVVAAPPQTQSVSGETVGQSTACTEDSDWADGEGFVEFDVVPGTIGHAFYVEFTENSLYHRVVFTDADGAEIESHMLGLGIGIEVGDVDDGDWEMEGVVPEGAAALALITCGNILDPGDFANPFQYDAGPTV